MVYVLVTSGFLVLAFGYFFVSYLAINNILFEHSLFIIIQWVYVGFLSLFSFYFLILS
jgi:hypothetical protein